MKPISLLCCFVVLLNVSCKQSSDNTQNLQAQIDSLQLKINKAYKPGFGEFMGSIQIHHEKLWFAGQNKNWKLADFEIHEMEEALDDLKDYCSERPETKSITMIYAPVNSLKKAIEQKNPTTFAQGFVDLTNTCNSCHIATNHEFNIIKIPTIPPFSNQEFKLE
jgi:hypothetical protein